MRTKKTFLASVLGLLLVALCIIGFTACNITVVCPHSWGDWVSTTDVTCTTDGVQKRRCSLCGTIESRSTEAVGHIPQEDDGDCTTAVTCVYCDKIFVEANATHKGGTATCDNLAKCDVCGKAYGEFADHILDEDDGDCTTEIICLLCGNAAVEANKTHTGGTATCDQQAKCDICGMEYGEFAEHTPDADDGDCTTPITCLLCGEITTKANANHIGGEATCTSKANCVVCGMEYGEVAEHILAKDDGDCTTAISCILCGKFLTEANESHVGGEATCTSKANCVVCGMEYGELAEHIIAEDDGDCTTAIICILCGEVTTEANASHVGGTATCSSAAKCDVCGKEYGNTEPHTPNADDGDCTTAITCSVCGEITTGANATHMGGTATCEYKASCAVCGMEYGELADHAGETVWVKHLNEHYLVYSCCYLQVSEAEVHTKVDGSCSICGFNPAVAITSTEITQEQTQVQIAISISDNPGIAGLMVTVQYSSDVFTLTQATNGEALSPLTFTAPSVLNSGCTFLWDGIEVTDKDVHDGEFLILTFDVSENAPASEYSILLKISAYDNDLNPVTLLITGGKITIQNT